MSVATAGASSSASWPRRRLWITLLVISALLNLCFIAGAAWSRFHAPNRGGVEQLHRQMAAELDLDAQQRAGFDKYVAAMRARNETMRQQVSASISAAWDEMAKPQADSAQVLKLFDEAADKRHTFQREATVQTLDFLSLLSPTQRSKFVALLREHFASRQHR